MYFSKEEIDWLAEERQKVPVRQMALMERFLAREFASEGGKEFAVHGFCRRLTTLARCIDNVFQTVSPDCEDVPNEESRKDIEINIQTFLLNVFGCLDNLAWICVKEKGVTKKDGTDLPRITVRLWSGHKRIKSSFSKEFLEYLSKYKDWYDYLQDYRDALAHRIPLYVPPYVVSPENQPAYQQIEIQKFDAQRNFRVLEYDKLDAEQMKLAAFLPCFRHSFGEKSKPVVFHAQMLGDFAKIDELGNKVLDELER